MASFSFHVGTFNGELQVNGRLDVGLGENNPTFAFTRQTTT